MAALRVIVADDDARVRGVLHEVLDDDDRFTVVALAGSGGQLLALAEALRPDVVLMDVRMPGGGAVAPDPGPERRRADAACVGADADVEHGTERELAAQQLLHLRPGRPGRVAREEAVAAQLLVATKEDRETAGGSHAYILGRREASLKAHRARMA